LALIEPHILTRYADECFALDARNIFSLQVVDYIAFMFLKFTTII